MAFDPNQYYAYASKLRIGLKMDGAELRSLISRAYYGAFITARDEIGYPSTGPDGHVQVINMYRGNETGDTIATNLSSLKKLRESADYKPNENLVVNDADKAIAYSKKVLSLLKKLPQATPAAVVPPSSSSSK